MSKITNPIRKLFACFYDSNGLSAKRELMAHILSFIIGFSVYSFLIYLIFPLMLLEALGMLLFEGLLKLGSNTYEIFTHLTLSILHISIICIFGKYCYSYIFSKKKPNGTLIHFIIRFLLFVFFIGIFVFSIEPILIIVRTSQLDYWYDYKIRMDVNRLSRLAIKFAWLLPYYMYFYILINPILKKPTRV